MTITTSYTLKCFRDGVPHTREYRETSYDRAMLIALQSGERWDYVETLSGNKRRYRSEIAEPEPRLFSTLADAITQDVARKERAQARLDAPKTVQKINGDSREAHVSVEFNELSRKQLRIALKRISSFLPPEFKRHHIEETMAKYLGATFNDSSSSMTNFIKECLENGILVRLRMGWFSLAEGYAVPPDPALLSASAVQADAPQTPVNFSNPSVSVNPLDQVFFKPFASQLEKAAAQVAVSNGAERHTNGALPPASDIAPERLQNSLLSMMVLADLVAAPTDGDEMLVLEIHDWMSLGAKLLERFSACVYKYEKAQQARNEMLRVLGRAPPMAGTEPKGAASTMTATN